MVLVFQMAKCWGLNPDIRRHYLSMFVMELLRENGYLSLVHRVWHPDLA